MRQPRFLLWKFHPEQIGFTAEGRYSLKQSYRKQKLTITLFALYILALIWIIVFKIQFSIGSLPQIRAINFIPFYSGNIKDTNVYIHDIIYNLLVFIPFGIYICILKRDWPFARKITPVFLTSFAFELIQYVFGIGATDINDLILNTIGGMIGIGIYYLLEKVFKDKTPKIVNILAIAAALLMLAFIGLLLSGRITITYAPH